MNAPRYRLEVVASKRSLNDFIRVPWAVYRDDPAWVPPLVFERREALAAEHPFFQHAKWRAWVLYDGAEPVGRISAQVDDLRQERYRDNAGYFGMIEAPDDSQAFAALFDAAESWLAQEGMERVVGPFNLSINQEVGLLVEGFETAPYFMMGHGRPYYNDAVEQLGYVGAKDLLAYLVPPDFEAPPVMAALNRRLQRRAVVRSLNRKAVERDLEDMRDIFNDAWSENWGFVPFTEAEFNAVGKELVMLLDDDFIRIIEVDGEPAGFIVMLPNLNEAIADLDGSLLPFGWAKLLWRLKVKHPTTARVPLMGVRKHFHNTQMGPGLAFLLIDAVRHAAVKKGVKSVELSWILEDNMGMRNIIETIGGVISKRYRLYEKDLAPAGEA